MLPFIAVTLKVMNIFYETQFDVCLVAIADAMTFSVMAVCSKTLFYKCCYN
jgi:hypothetical protein